MLAEADRIVVSTDPFIQAVDRLNMMRGRYDMASIISLDGYLCCGPKWKQLYQSAILELDSTKLPARIAEARVAMIDRSEEVQGNPSSDEHHVLNDALRALGILESVIKREQPRAA